jgi:hypothetical protein
VGADLGALLDDAYAEVTFAAGRELLQTDRRGETRRPGPDDHDIVLHPLARRPLLAHHPSADLSGRTIEDLHKNGSALLPCDERLAR